MYRVDNWINERSGWIFESIESQYINISIYQPLSDSSYLKMPVELKSPIKGLINIKNKDQKYFVRHINPVKIHPVRITREDKKLANDLDYDGFEFPVQEKIFSKNETKNNICINVFCYEQGLTFPIYISKEKLDRFVSCN